MILLMNCSTLKSKSPGKARDVYRGELVKLGLEYAEKSGMVPFFASGRYGIIHADDWVEPYDEKRTRPVPTSDYPQEPGFWLGSKDYFRLAPKHYTRLLDKLPFEYNQTYGMQKNRMRKLIDAL